MGRRRKFNIAVGEMETTEEEPLFDDLVEPEYPLEDETMDKSTDSDAYNDEGTIEVASEELEFEYYVSGSQTLFEEFKKGDLIPEKYVTPFLLRNGHVSKRLKS